MSCAKPVIDVMQRMRAELRQGSQCGITMLRSENPVARDADRAIEVVKQFRDAAVEFYAGIQAMVICQSHEAPTDITEAVNTRAAKACEQFEAALARFEGGAQ